MIAVKISEAVWSAVAPLSIPSNLEPSLAISLPSTVPVTVIFPVTSNPDPTSTFPTKVLCPVATVISVVADGCQ